MLWISPSAGRYPTSVPSDSSASAATAPPSGPGTRQPPPPSPTSAAPPITAAAVPDSRASHAHLRRLGLHGGGEDEAVDGGGDPAAVVRHELDTGGAQRVGRFAVTARVERAIRALHGVAARPHEARQRAHARAADAREVVARSTHS